MKILFQDRWAPWAVLLSLGLLGYLETTANDIMSDYVPDFRKCLAAPTLHHNDLVGFTGEVVAPGVLRRLSVDVRVEGLPKEAVPGEFVSILGRFQREGYIRVEKSSWIPYYAIRRPLMTPLSLLALLLLLRSAHKRFSFRLSDGLFAARPPSTPRSPHA